MNRPERSATAAVLAGLDKYGVRGRGIKRRKPGALQAKASLAPRLAGPRLTVLEQGYMKHCAKRWANVLSHIELGLGALD